MWTAGMVNNWKSKAISAEVGLINYTSILVFLAEMLRLRPVWPNLTIFPLAEI